MQRVLIANDSFEGMEIALAKAALIEHYTGATIEVAEVIFDTVAEENLPEVEKSRLIEAFVAAERNGLRGLLEPYKEKIASSEPTVLWSKRADEAIVAEARAREADLIIKPLSHHSKIGDVLNMPLDWRLIRTAAAPVLISKPAEWTTGGSVLAAFDVGDPQHSALNKRILAVAIELSSILDARLHAASVYPDLGQTVNDYQVAIDYQGIKEDMRQAREVALAALLDGLVDTAVERHVVEGKPAKAISLLARELEPTVVVLGTSARAGLTKLVLGNTSEAILGRLHSDVLTVR